MAKKCWEDFEAGQSVRTAAITITEAHLVQWAGLTMDFYPLHMDEEFAKKTAFGGRIAHGPLIFAMSVGLVAMANIFEDSILAWIGVENMRLPAPVRIGDSIKVDAMVKEKREIKNPERGITIFHYAVKNQKEATVMEFDYILMMHRRSS